MYGEKLFQLPKTWFWGEINTFLPLFYCEWIFTQTQVSDYWQLIHWGSLKTWHRANCPAERMVLPTCFDLVEESFSDEEVQFKKFSPPVKTSCFPAENIHLMKPLTNALFIYFFFLYHLNP